MKILVVEGRESIGGGQVVTKAVCEALQRNHRVEVFIPGARDSPIAQYLETFPQHHFHNRKYKNGRKGIKDYFSLFENLIIVGESFFKTLRETIPDVIYIQHMSTLPIAVLINLMFRIKIVAHVHVAYVDSKARFLINLLLKSRQIVKIVGVSRFSLGQFSLDNQRKSVVIHNPVALRPIFPHDEKSYNIAVVGDVYYGKGHHVLLEALAKGGDKYTVHIIGNMVDDEYRKYLDNTFPQVSHIYTGMLHNVSEYLEDNHIVVVAVVAVVGFETFSLAMVESWGQGIPTIATDDFGMKELVEEYLPMYKDNMLFPLGDAETLYSKIESLTSNVSLYHAISNDARDVVKNNLNKDLFSLRINALIEGIKSN